MYGSDAISGVAHVITNKGTFGAGGGRASRRARRAASSKHGIRRRAPIAQHHTLAARGGGIGRRRIAITGRDVAQRRVCRWMPDTQRRTPRSAATRWSGRTRFCSSRRCERSRFDFNAPVSPPLARVLGSRAVPLIARAARGQVINEHTVRRDGDLSAARGLASHARRGIRSQLRRARSATKSRIGRRHAAWREREKTRAARRCDTAPRLRLEPSARADVDVHARPRAFATCSASDPAPRAVIGTATGRRAAMRSTSTRSTTPVVRPDQARHCVVRSISRPDIRGERNSSFGERLRHGVVADGRRVVRHRRDRSRLQDGAPRSAREFVRRRRVLGDALTTTQFRQMANPHLAPETTVRRRRRVRRLVASERLAMSLTAFDQRADGLIQHVIPDAARCRRKSVQQQNVGRISNRGGEAQDDRSTSGAADRGGRRRRRSRAKCARCRRRTRAIFASATVCPRCRRWSGHGRTVAHDPRCARDGRLPRSSAHGQDTIGCRTTRRSRRVRSRPTSMRVYWVRIRRRAAIRDGVGCAPGAIAHVVRAS